MTIITTLINNTENVVVLREGQVGVLRKVCDIPAGKTHQVRSNLTATYKEYWCAVQPSKNNDKFILTSDDCIDWKEIEIRPKGPEGGFEWVGRVPANKKSSGPGQSSSPSASPSRHAPSISPSGPSSSFLAKVLPKKLIAWVSKSKSSGPESPTRAKDPE